MKLNSFIPPQSIKTRFVSDISSEGELLLCCARTQLDSTTKEKIVTLANQSMDWSYLVKMATYNCVIPLLHNSLMIACPDAMPQPIRDTLTNDVQLVKSRNEKNISVLLDILKLFNANEIPVIPFKGLTFALSNYGNLALRQCGDIDLMVHAEDFIKAKDLLIRNGYCHTMFGHHETACVQAQLVREDGLVSVDLHYGVTPCYLHVNMKEAISGVWLERSRWNRVDNSSTNWFFFLDTQSMWERLDSLIVKDISIPVFSPEDMFLISYINGVKESWRLLRRICDIAELIRANPQMNWEWILTQIHALRCERKFFLGLGIVSDLLNTPLPDEISRKFIKSSIRNSLIAVHTQHICQTKLKIDHNEFRYLSALFTMDRFKDRIWYIIYIIRRLAIADQPRKTIIKYIFFIKRVLGQFALAIIYKLT